MVCGRLAGCTAAIGDPDPDLRRILGEALAAAGCTAGGAQDGEEALDVMSRGPTAVAILNLVMPRVDALTALARMRQDDRLRDVPVLVIVPAELSVQDLDRLREATGRVRHIAAGPVGRIQDLLAGYADLSAVPAGAVA